MRTRTNLKAVSGKLDLVALVDVLFLVLIFFLISSSLVFQPGSPVELPKAHAASMRAAEKIVVTLTGDGLLFFNDNPVEWDELERELHELVYVSRRGTARRLGKDGNAQNTPTYSPMLVLRADADIDYDRIVKVMALARSLDLGVYLVTDPRDATPQVP